jgi:ABC transport system ATP-binding/permease protein
MKERALESIISIFALAGVIKPSRGYTMITNILEVYLSIHFSKHTTEAYLEKFTVKLQEYAAIRQKKISDFDAFLDNEIEAHCYILSREVTFRQRMLALIYLIEFVPYISGRTALFVEDESFLLVKRVAEGLDIPENDYLDAVSFSIEAYQMISAQNQVFVVTDNQSLEISGINTKVIEGFNAQIIFLRIASLDTILFKVSGDAYLEINDTKLYKRRTYVLNPGAVIHSSEGFHIYYNDIVKSLLSRSYENRLTLSADKLDYKFRNGNYGIREVSFDCYSGEILAIMGGSGSGKTTLMSLLIGALKPLNGSVKLNNIDVCSNPQLVKGYIGYVPQDDALNEDLTAFDNLWYIAGLSAGNLSKEARGQKVDLLLKELDLSDIRDLKVGSPLEKIISGGQRKRLNIAIELIRNPGILFLDEPTSGLSSADSELIMELLKKAALKGQMIILNIHQPSSDIYKTFDKILFIDKGGYPVYFGPAMQIASYLKKALRLADAHESECHTCGNLNPEEIFHLVETSRIACSQNSSSRQFPPQRWHRRFLREKETIVVSGSPDTEFKPLKPEIPNKVKQFSIYTLRNLFTKIADYPYLILSLTLPPILALLLSVFSRYISPLTDVYSYYENENIPPFIFMSVIVAMFVGVMAGSPEIIKDRKALKRESFLNLSFTAYISAKLFYLVCLSAVQMGAYVLVSRFVLGIPSGNGHFFIIMWATAVSSSVLGLTLSSVFKTMAAVYVSIPFILIPQILFSGAVIDFNKINPFFASEKYVPAISEIMVSRWAYESVVTSLFMSSAHSDEFYENDRAVNMNAYYRFFVVSELEKNFYRESFSSMHTLTPDSADFQLILNGIAALDGYLNQNNFQSFEKEIKGDDFQGFIRTARRDLTVIADSVQFKKDHKIEQMGSESYDFLRNTLNKKMVQMVTDETNIQKIKISKSGFVRKLTPVYFTSDNKLGRSHLYAAEKQIGNLTLSTFLFNLLVICSMSLGLIVLIVLKRPKFN